MPVRSVMSNSHEYDAYFFCKSIVRDGRCVVKFDGRFRDFGSMLRVYVDSFCMQSIWYALDGRGGMECTWEIYVKSLMYSGSIGEKYDWKNE